MKAALIQDNGTYAEYVSKPKDLTIEINVPQLSFSKYVPNRIKNTIKSFWMVTTYSL